jgi:nicotinate-nucleotide adenylyltransferase
VRIAILGGTFDPIHNGHLAVACSVSSTFRTDEVHFVPAYSAPHKQSHESISAFHRFAMIALAIAPFDGFRVSTIEVDAMEKRYTVDTLERMSAEDPDGEFLFALGTDMYRDFETWKNYRAVLKLAHLAVVHRPGFAFREDLAPYRVLQEGEAVTLPDQPGVYYLPFVQQPVSSTAIREGRRNGEDFSHCVPAPVWSYMEKHNLYAGGPGPSLQ